MAAEKELTEPEFLVLGLVAEMPRHGYQLAQEIDERGMREWTSIGFSSIYFLLDKLKQRRLVQAKEPSREKAKKIFSITAAGKKRLVARTIASLSTYRRSTSSVLLGMLHWPVLQREEALTALEARAQAVKDESIRLAEIRTERQPLPDFIEVLFDFSLGQLQAEVEWITQTLDYMKTKPWID